MDIEELLIIVEKSRGSKIQKIDPDFYEMLRNRIKELEELRKELEEVERVDDEIRTLRKIQRRIFEARVSKIVRAAWAEVCGTESGIEGMENLIDKERELFRKVVEVLTGFRKWVFEGETYMEEKSEAGEGSEGRKISLVRVKQDIPEFEGVDGKTYKLRKGDVVTLPSLNANVLVKSDAVEVIEVKR